jgi:hypothetical protein
VNASRYWTSYPTNDVQAGMENARLAFGSPPGPCLTAHQQRRTLGLGTWSRKAGEMPGRDARGTWFFLGVGALIGLVLGILVGVTTDVSLAPEAGVILGALFGWLFGRVST